MKNINMLFQTGLVVTLLAAAACSKTSAPVASDVPVLQGTWKGRETGVTGPGSPVLVLTGNNLEFHGADPNEWYKGTYTLLETSNPKQLVAIITECPDPTYVGKRVFAIYRLEGGTLTLSANEPGGRSFPAAFDSPGTRQFTFQLDKP